MEKDALPAAGLARKPSSEPFIEPPPLDTLSSGGDNKTEERAEPDSLCFSLSTIRCNLENGVCLAFGCGARGENAVFGEILLLKKDGYWLILPLRTADGATGQATI
jgi:hypothetical protein